MTEALTLAPHPLLDLQAFVTEFPAPLAEGPWGLELPALVARPGPDLPAVPEGVEVKTVVRDLLRHGGFKPAGRSKPASEYVQKAIPAGKLGAINAAVDACNAASFFAALPISVVDLDRTDGPLHVAVAPPGASYVFNPSGQVLDLGGLLCLHDGAGPIANAVKDSQRTKTHDGTHRTLSVLWGTTALPGRSQAAAAWYRAQLEAAGAQTRGVEADGSLPA